MAVAVLGGGIAPAGKRAADAAAEALADAVAARAAVAAPAVVAGPAADAGGSTSVLAGALLVLKSTVTLRIGSGAVAGRLGAGAVFGFGPDNSSGTTSTTSATRIDAPISRSLTRRSINWKYIRDAPQPAAILRFRANPSPAPRCERSR